ncbi:MAG: tRNA 2-thiocytidine biosynthesis protein TtcA [Paludibacteraceae bacterium]|nr:tRNA 2-thiocytidine biosynthesis protein TtcA [Paludibacteraceae bacterium]
MRTPEQIELSRLQNRLTKRFHKACADYSLIENGDHILIALSGGKDSLALVELLGKRAQIFVPRFKVTALHVRVKERAYISDLSYLQSFCDAFRVPLLVRDTSIGESSVSASGVPTNNMQWGASGGLSAKRSNPCFLCSWYRRKALFDTAQELGCNKIAFGHHKDDIVETLLMNLVFEGKFSTIYPKLQMDKMPLQLIRPLCLIEERDLRRYAELQGYVRQKQPCPFEHDSVRSNIKDLVTQLEQLNPNVRDSLWGAIARR